MVDGSLYLIQRAPFTVNAGSFAIYGSKAHIDWANFSAQIRAHVTYGPQSPSSSPKLTYTWKDHPIKHIT